MLHLPLYEKKYVEEYKISVNRACCYEQQFRTESLKETEQPNDTANDMDGLPPPPHRKDS